MFFLVTILIQYLNIHKFINIFGHLITIEAFLQVWYQIIIIVFFIVIIYNHAHQFGQILWKCNEHDNFGIKGVYPECTWRNAGFANTTMWDLKKGFQIVYYQMVVLQVPI